MTKFKEGFVREAKKSIRQEKEQKRLHEKHDISDPDTVIVEKSNMVKFLIRCLSWILRIAATFIMFVLAAAGLITLLYPDVRSEFLIVFTTIVDEIRSMTGL